MIEKELPTSQQNPTLVPMQSKQYKHLLELIGNTPMAKLDFGIAPTLLAKLEYLNPGGSLKDRSALFMIEEAEAAGTLKPGGTIIEASSGNQGIALSMIGVLKGYKVIITVPEHTSPEKIATMRAYGTHVIICADTDTLDDPNSYHMYAQKLFERTPNAIIPNQYLNTANPRAHYQSTGKEIWEQTGGTVTHFFAGTGSCGTICGVGKYLKEQNPAIKVIGIDAATSLFSSTTPKAYETEGIGIDVISDILDESVIDEIITIEDKDAFAMTRTLAKTNGLLVGPSSGAVMHIALSYAKKLSKTDVMVVIFADSGRAYLSKIFDTKMQDS